MINDLKVPCWWEMIWIIKQSILGFSKQHKTRQPQTTSYQLKISLTLKQIVITNQ
jgi:hypothetical protein